MNFASNCYLTSVSQDVVRSEGKTAMLHTIETYATALVGQLTAWQVPIPL
jgi:hypothetical protein